MTVISSNLKDKIINNLQNILCIEDPKWTNINNNLKIKIIHHLCNHINNNTIKQISTPNLISNDFIFKIPLKNQRPKKIMQFCEFNKQTNTIIFNEFKNIILEHNYEFRNIYNKKNKCYNFNNISKNNYNDILNKYNYIIYNYLKKNLNIINVYKLFINLTEGNHQKIMFDFSLDNLKSQNQLQINQINYNSNILNIEFNNDIIIEFELYFTSEKITNNIPAKYKISLINII